MKNFYRWITSSGVRLAFIFAFTTTMLLIVLNIVVSQRSEDSFVAAVRSIPFKGGTLYQLEPNTDDYIPGLPKSIENLKTPRDMFNNRFHTALTWVTGLGILISAFLGFVLSQEFISKPLNRLQLAIGKLKNRDFSATAVETGLPEFDKVAQEFNELAQELERAELLRKDLISDTSHELKTPLTSLQGQLEGMRDGIIPKDTEHIDGLLTQVARLHDLTERLQEYTRLRNRTARITKTRIQLKAFMENLEKEISSDLKKHKVSLSISIPDDVHIQADERLLEELFLNLFRNSFTYAGAEHITIALKKGHLYFADDGKGVPPDTLHHIFERFYRVEQSRNRKTGGLGLGLAIVKEIVEAHEWSITAKAVEPHGLAFLIKL
jgi:signal transduction histidine kinase